MIAAMIIKICLITGFSALRIHPPKDRAFPLQPPAPFFGALDGRDF